MQAAQRHSSNNLAILNTGNNNSSIYNNDDFDDESSMDSYISSPAHLSPNGNGMTRKGSFALRPNHINFHHFSGSQPFLVVDAQNRKFTFR
jgi:hypothetical protein